MVLVLVLVYQGDLKVAMATSCRKANVELLETC